MEDDMKENDMEVNNETVATAATVGNDGNDSNRDTITSNNNDDRNIDDDGDIGGSEIIGTTAIDECTKTITTDVECADTASCNDADYLGGSMDNNPNSTINDNIIDIPSDDMGFVDVDKAVDDDVQAEIQPDVVLIADEHVIPIEVDTPAAGSTINEEVLADSEDKPSVSQTSGDTSAAKVEEVAKDSGVPKVVLQQCETPVKKRNSTFRVNKIY